MISTVLKTPAAKRDIPIPKCLVDCLRETKENSISDYVIADSKGEPLAASQFQRVWQYVVVRSTKPVSYTHLEIAEKIYERHRFFTEQLVAAGVDLETAEQEACRMEHAISEDSFQKLKEKVHGTD